MVGNSEVNIATKGKRVVVIKEVRWGFKIGNR
jgi:hypothetical protein